MFPAKRRRDPSKSPGPFKKRKLSTGKAFGGDRKNKYGPNAKSPQKPGPAGKHRDRMGGDRDRKGGKKFGDGGKPFGTKVAGGKRYGGKKPGGEDNRFGGKKKFEGGNKFGGKKTGERGSKFGGQKGKPRPAFKKGPGGSKQGFKQKKGKG